GEHVAECAYPSLEVVFAGVTEQQAQFLGILASDGWVSENGRMMTVTSASAKIRAYVLELWRAVGGGGASYYPTLSGFNHTKVVGQLRLAGLPDWLQTIRLYNEEVSSHGHRTKRVPWQILNSAPDVMLAF